MHFAAFNGNLSLVQLMVESFDANVNTTDKVWGAMGRLFLFDYCRFLFQAGKMPLDVASGDVVQYLQDKTKKDTGFFSMLEREIASLGFGNDDGPGHSHLKRIEFKEVAFSATPHAHSHDAAPVPVRIISLICTRCNLFCKLL